MKATTNIPRCKVGELAIAIIGPNVGKIVRIDAIEPSTDGWAWWRVTSIGGPIAVPQRDGEIAARASSCAPDRILAPLRCIEDAPVAECRVHKSQGA